MRKENNIEFLKMGFIMVAFLSAFVFLVSCEEESNDVTPIPVITSFSPDNGEPGDNVTIVGTDLEDATVTFNGVTATISSNSATEIVATVPEDATTGKIRVETEGGIAESTNDFTVVIVGAAVIESVTPRSAQAGEDIVITGIDMATVSAVSIDGVEATIVETTETTATVTIGEGTAIGEQTLSVVNEGGTTTTSFDALEFYVIQLIDPIYRETFDNNADDVIGMSGSPDTEESTVHGVSVEVAEQAQDLPPAIDGNFFHMEGYSSTDYSGSYMAQLGLRTQDVGTFADFFGNTDPADIYYNIQINFGDLPADYEDVVVGLRFRFEEDDYEWQPTIAEIEELGFEANADGWYSLSVPATVFDDDASIGTYPFTDMKRYSVAKRRDFGTGTTLPLSEAEGAIFTTLSFDNVIISIGGPLTF